jgi:hypothetical protein
LYDHRDTGKQSDKSSDCKANPNEPNLDAVPNDAKKKHSYSRFSYPNDHYSSHLAKQLILDCCKVDHWIPNISKLLPKAVAACYGN